MLTLTEKFQNRFHESHIVLRRMLLSSINPRVVPHNSRRPTKLRSIWLVWIAGIFFFCAGHLLIPLLGIEDDEALFGAAIYRPETILSRIHIGHIFIPTMLISYLGALK